MNLDEMIEIGLSNDLTLSQIGYMEHLAYGKEYPLRFAELERQDLAGRKLIQKGKVNIPEWEKFRKGSILKPIEYSLQSNIEIIINMLSDKLIQHEPEKDSKSKIASQFVNNEELGELYYVWLCLWPTEGNSNKGWEEVFGIRHNQFKLRRALDKYATFFKKQARKRNIDVGVMIISSYLFIKSHIRNGKAFIPKISTYTEDWEYWYEKAYDAVEGKTFDEIIGLFVLTAEQLSPAKRIEDTTVKHTGFVMD